MRILVIDDEQPTLNMFRLLLEAYGAQVYTATNGFEGLRVFEQERPDVVLTDVKMPGMDGIDVLKRIKEMDPHAEVIIITGHGDMDLAILALNLSATDFINKPVQPQALTQALKTAQGRIANARNMSQSITVQDAGEAAVMTIRNLISSDSEIYLDEGMKQARSLARPLIILHFDENASANGAGLGLLTQLLLRAKEQGDKVCIAGLPEHFSKMFAVVGISKIVDIYEDDAAALAAF